MDDVAIIGVGHAPLRPVRRQVRLRHGRRRRRDGAPATPASRGTTCRSRFGGSWEVDQTDAAHRRCSASPASRSRTCTTAAPPRPARSSRPPTRSAGQADIGVAVGMDKHPPRLVQGRPRRRTNMPAWYGENGQFVTTKFFGMKINRYMHDHGISPRRSPRCAAKNFRNGVAEPERLPPHADVGGGDPQLADAQLPADAVHVLRARRRRRGRSCCAGPTSRNDYTDDAHLPEGDGDPHPQLRRVRGAHVVGGGRRGRVARRSTPRRPRTSWPASAPKTSTSSSCRTPTPAPR